jgi:O-acetyl-ADP-ribose deacetylase (regulator of RNase III)
MEYKLDNVHRILKDKDFDIFVHGCNSKGKFKSGIAGIVRELYEHVAESYEKFTAIYGFSDLSLGKIDIEPVAPKKYIVNAITQEGFGYDGSKYASYDAIDDCFRRIADTQFSKGVKIYYPLIGCGLGGVQWSIVQKIIDYRLKGLDHYCIVRDQDCTKHGLMVDGSTFRKEIHNELANVDPSIFPKDLFKKKL